MRATFCRRVGTLQKRQGEFKTERREARALEFEGQPALASVRLLPWRYSIRGVVAESPPVGKMLLSECAMTGFCHGAGKIDVRCNLQFLGTGYVFG